MQEIIYDLRPDLVIETGTFMSGSALFYCHVMDLVNNGQVVTIDSEFRENRPKHFRLKNIFGSSTDEAVVNEVDAICSGKNTVIVTLDSDHSKEHVFNEIMAYKDFVTKGGYLIVEDTALHGNPIHPESSDDPMSAVEEFMEINNEFMIDRSREKFFMTWHPKGFLKRL